jgi:hypothetical protein
MLTGGGVCTGGRERERGGRDQEKLTRILSWPPETPTAASIEPRSASGTRWSGAAPDRSAAGQGEAGLRQAAREGRAGDGWPEGVLLEACSHGGWGGPSCRHRRDEHARRHGRLEEQPPGAGTGKGSGNSEG